MADNISITPGSGAKAATDEVTYSGDIAAVQLVRLVDVTGAEGSKTVTAYTMPVTGNFFQSTQPVSIASLPALGAGTAIVGKVGIDQTSPGTTNAFSLSHIGGTAVATGNGTAGAGVPRVAIASDNSPFSVTAAQSGTWNINNISGLVSLPTGAATAANQASLATAIAATNTKLDSLITQGSSTAAVPIAQADEYETVAASQTDQVLGVTGAAGDRLSGLLIQPGTTSPGNVILKDGTTTIYTFPGGASSVTTLIPFTVPVGLKSVNGAWKVTTGANVTVIGVGDFT